MRVLALIEEVELPGLITATISEDDYDVELVPNAPPVVVDSED